MSKPILHDLLSCGAMARLIRRVETIAPKRAMSYGGKTRNLAALVRAGFTVPAAWAIPGSVCSDYVSRILATEEQLPALLKSQEDPAELARIRLKLLGGSLSSEVDAALSEVYRRLALEGSGAMAVRSSSSFEDTTISSAAGVHQTILHVTNEEQLHTALKECWSSLFSCKALSYFRTYCAEKTSRSASLQAMGTLIQAMVPAEVSGVLFTANPMTGDADEMVVNAVYGLGCSLVDGRVSPDVWTIDKASKAPRDRIAGKKSIRTVMAAGFGVEDRPVDAADVDRLCLDESELQQLIHLGLRVEECFDGPRDIEWAFADGVLYVLQARPITSLGFALPKRRTRRRVPTVDRSRLVWSNVNVGEALPGVATPLTWSVASGFSELGFRRAFGSMGCSVPRDAELLGNFRGRIYLNLSEFISIASQIPGLNPDVLLALGGGGRFDEFELQSDARGRFGFVARLPLTLARFVRENYRIGDRVGRFESFFHEEYARIGRLDFRVLSPSALSRVLRDIEHLLDESGSVMLTCYGNLLLSVVALRSVVRGVAGDRSDVLFQDLLSGLADVVSAAPGVALWHIAEMARTEPDVRRYLEEEDIDRMQIDALPSGATRRALDRFLEAYGHRGPREAELLEARWSEDPSLLFTSLRLHLVGPEIQRKPIDVERELRQRRESAERELVALSVLPGRAAVRHLLSFVQRFTRLRERLRDYVVHVLGLFRRVALDASRRIQKAESKAPPDAAFYLSLDELKSMLRGEVASVASLVSERKRHVERNRAVPSPPDAFVGVPPPDTTPSFDGSVLRGLAASRGLALGRARVLHQVCDAKAFVPGEILVVACADVGWSPLFLMASAVVTDLGGPLSHAAVVLREYGVPAVVNVTDASRQISTGDLLEVDGRLGIVSVLERVTESHLPRAAN
ncbi:MAG: PEP/pyruvate-binding domain-containing protein [Myxococcota bacterium]